MNERNFRTEWTVKVVLHGAMQRDSLQAVAVELKVRVSKTVTWELLSTPGGDRKLCPDVMAH